MGSELALTGDDLAFLANGIEAVCGLFDNIVNNGADIIHHGIEFWDNRAEEEYNLKMEEIHAKTERMRIEEQSKCVQKALDVALKAYTSKIEFYQAQLESCDNFFKPQIAEMQNEIRLLEEKRDAAFNDTDQYVLISKRIDRITEYCDKVNAKYLKFHDNLTTAVKLAQLEAPDTTVVTAFINENQTKYLN